ncbi:4-alpha-glucanotransferase [Verrucomicrobium sp. BvORR034]|uniref:4-alpha-glucanotransferase n=1 Tax=Verrucomicrobium sp. BvORR034 TaxID=1396418 RepID=UPI0006789D2D|nr:4-alpha-glucanotransferase [Verrucomicrobium sp. BvORR034]
MSAPTFNKNLAGLLVPVFALRHANDFGIGDTLAMKEAVTFCKENRFAVLQTLPIHETIGDHSPYNPISSRALSPALLDLSPANVPGLTEGVLAHFAPGAWLAQLREGTVKHHTVQLLKLHILLAAFHRFKAAQAETPDLWSEFEEFQRNSADWLPVYTLYRLLIREYEGNPNWTQWRPEHHRVEAAEGWFESHPERRYLTELRQGFAYVQWVAWRQWQEVRRHADACGVMLMGEMSFGVSKSSVDVWASPELFDADWNMGTRPIVYFDTNKDSERWGQNWGLPPYRWENHRSSGFAWLRGRIASERQFFHICRLDHLRGYFRAYMFPWGGGARHTEFATLTDEEVLRRTGGRMPRFVPGPDEDPVSARMNELQGHEIISVMKEAAGDMYLIAEIMGNMPDYMRRTLDDLGVANLVFPQLERTEERTLLPPTTYRRPSLGSYANHDHAPLAALYPNLQAGARANLNGDAAKDLANLLGFAGWSAPAPDTLNDDLLLALQEALFKTPCDLTVLMSSDLLGTPQRFNLPGSYGTETWNERLDHPLSAFAHHPVFGPRIARVRELIQRTHRQPEKADI